MAIPELGKPRLQKCLLQTAEGDSASSDHLNGVFFVVSLVNGSAIIAKLRTNLR